MMEKWKLLDEDQQKIYQMSMLNIHDEWLDHFTWDSLNLTVLHLGKW